MIPEKAFGADARRDYGMVSLDEMRRELNAIEEFNRDRIKQGSGAKVELIGDLVRLSRKRELRMLIKVVVEQN